MQIVQVQNSGGGTCSPHTNECLFEVEHVNSWVVNFLIFNLICKKDFCKLLPQLISDCTEDLTEISCRTRRARSRPLQREDYIAEICPGLCTSGPRGHLRQQTTEASSFSRQARGQSNMRLFESASFQTLRNSNRQMFDCPLAHICSPTIGLFRNPGQS